MWYQHSLDVIDVYGEPDSQGCYIFGSGRKKRELKEVRQKEKNLVNLVTPIAQTTELAKSTLKRERKNDEVNIGKKAFVPRISQKKIRPGPEDQDLR